MTTFHYHFIVYSTECNVPFKDGSDSEDGSQRHHHDNDVNCDEDHEHHDDASTLNEQNDSDEDDDDIEANTTATSSIIYRYVHLVYSLVNKPRLT